MTDDIDEAIRLERRRILDGIARLRQERGPQLDGYPGDEYAYALGDVADIVNSGSEVSNGQ